MHFGGVAVFTRPFSGLLLDQTLHLWGSFACQEKAIGIRQEANQEALARDSTRVKWQTRRALLPKWNEDSTAPKSHNFAGESALLRLQNRRTVISNQVGTNSGSLDCHICQAGEFRNSSLRPGICFDWVLRFCRCDSSFKLNPEPKIPTMGNLVTKDSRSAGARILSAGNDIESGEAKGCQC